MKFRIVRRLWFALSSISSTITFALCFVMAEYLPLAWPLRILAVFPFLACSLSTWIAIDARLGKVSASHHTIGAELIGVSIVIFCHLAFILLVISTEPDTRLPGHGSAILLTLRVCYDITAVLLASYLLTLATLAIAAWYTVDPQIWSRNPAASPGHFPLRLVFAALTTRAEEAGLPSVAHSTCLPGCGCQQKLPVWSPTARSDMDPVDLIAASRSTLSSDSSRVPLALPTPAQRSRVYSVQFGSIGVGGTA